MKKSVILDEFIGQSKTIETLKISVAASKKRQETMGHILLTGPLSSGRHTLANAIVQELNANVKIINIKDIRKEAELVAVFTNLTNGSVLIIEEIDEIKQDLIFLLCSAMEDYQAIVTIGKGPSAREITLDLPKFTVIGIAETRHKLSKKLEQCFYIDANFTKYSDEELFQLAKKWCCLNKSKITDEAATKIAICSEGSSKLLHGAMKRARDFADVYNNSLIDVDIIDKTIANLSDKDFMSLEECN